MARPIRRGVPDTVAFPDMLATPAADVPGAECGLGIHVTDHERVRVVRLSGLVFGDCAGVDVLLRATQPARHAGIRIVMPVFRTFPDALTDLGGAITTT